MIAKTSTSEEGNNSSLRISQLLPCSTHYSFVEKKLFRSLKTKILSRRQLLAQEKQRKHQNKCLKSI